VYATAGQRILVDFAIDETLMGGVLVVTEDPVIRWHVEGEEEEHYELRILRNGRAMHTLSFIGSSSGEICDERLMIHRPGQHYYYLEVVSAEEIPQYRSNAAHALGGRAWSSPIWLETADWIVS
jgi:hypothetical protein